MNPIRKALPVLCDDVARLRAWFTVHRGPQPGTLRTHTDPTPPTLADGTAPAYWLGSEPLQPSLTLSALIPGEASAPTQPQQNDQNDPPSPITSFYSDLMARHGHDSSSTPPQIVRAPAGPALLVSLEPVAQPVRATSHATARITSATASCTSLLRGAGRVLRSRIAGLLGGISPRAAPPPKRTITTPKPLKK